MYRWYRVTDPHDPNDPRCPARFRATVHGTAFAGRERHLDHLHEGDRVLVVPDPPGGEDPEVWIHLASGDPVGHLPPEIAAWLWPHLQAGGEADARALRVHGADTPSWRRVVVQVELRGGHAATR